MAEINPAEVSAILKQQLANFDTQSNVEEVGTVLTIGDGIARVYGLENVQYGELVRFQAGVEGIVLNLEEDNVGIVILGEYTNIKEGTTVKTTGNYTNTAIIDANENDTNTSNTQASATTTPIKLTDLAV